ncbi:MAG: hypothetical protein KKA07_10245 [Bacteroidetes bacterium]|nr:hypothetical protein [Bacteroidota bacterium]MBU1719441.1 hypothetical protein [Bacteroidota bacterium]
MLDIINRLEKCHCFFFVEYRGKGLFFDRPINKIKLLSVTFFSPEKKVTKNSSELQGALGSFRTLGAGARVRFPDAGAKFRWRKKGNMYPPVGGLIVFDPNPL